MPKKKKKTRPARRARASMDDSSAWQYRGQYVGALRPGTLTIRGWALGRRPPRVPAGWERDTVRIRYTYAAGLEAREALDSQMPLNVTVMIFDRKVS